MLRGHALDFHAFNFPEWVPSRLAIIMSFSSSSSRAGNPRVYVATKLAAQ
jgi:hypothetical protein